MIPRIPQENGVEKIMNKTIMERARSMRIHVGLPLQFWVETVYKTIYLINPGPSSALNGGIPEESWTRKEADISFLRVFFRSFCAC